MVDFFAAAQRVISLILSGSEIAIIVWLVSGGIIFVLRGISFWIDNLIVNFIGSIYNYFMELLEGTMFNKTVTDQLLTNVYVFIGIVVFFRLAMLLIKYLMNPELVSDDKAGVNSLIKRVIIGMCGILMVPFIFDKATELQAAIIKDQVIQQIIIPSDMIEATSKKVENAGKYIGTYVFAGFINPSSKASAEIKKEYSIALEKGDFSSLNFNKGGFLGIGYTSYDYSYFYLLSTFVLGYVLYLMLKYCLDIVVRFFKLLLYQLLAPVAMVEYMVSGSDNGVFKNWKNGVIGTYCMLFVRVLSIWFVVFVMSLMSGDYATYTDGTLLANDDHLLRALIIIGLLAFMMDLPKIVGSIFGLDLEQESSATGLLKSIGGIVKGVGMGALSMGGAALGGAVGSLGGMQKAGLQNNKDRNKAIKQKMAGNQGMSRRDALNSLKSSGALQGANASALSSAAASAKSAGLATLKGMGAAAIGSTSIGKSIQSGYASVSSEMSKDRQKAKQESAEAEERAYRQHQIEVTDQINATTTVVAGEQQRSNIKLDNIVDNTERTVTQTVNIDQKLGNISGDISNIAQNTETTATQTVNIDQKLGKVSGNIENIAQNTETTATQTVNMDQKLGKISGDVSNIADNTEITADVALNVEPLVGSMDESLKDINTNTEISADVDLNVEPIINDIGQNVNRINNDQNNADTNSNNS